MSWGNIEVAFEVIQNDCAELVLAGVSKRPTWHPFVEGEETASGTVYTERMTNEG
jgi:hypothetical protein